MIKYEMQNQFYKTTLHTSDYFGIKIKQVLVLVM